MKAEGVDMSDTRTMTRIALVSEVRRLRERLALIEGAEADRAREAVKRRPSAASERWNNQESAAVSGQDGWS